MNESTIWWLIAGSLVGIELMTGTFYLLMVAAGLAAAAVAAARPPVFFARKALVERVLANTTLYAAQLSGQPQSLRQRLGTVGPRSASAPPSNTELP